MLPEDWKKYKLGEIADITSSKRIFLSDYVDEGIPFYRSKEIIEKANGGEISVELFITNERYTALKQKFGSPVSGDLLIAAVGERAGTPYCVKDDGDFYFKDGNLIWLRSFHKTIHSKFLYYYLRTKFGQSALESTMIGSAQKALTIIGLKNLEVSFPPIYAQTQIASVLSSLDDKIELNLQMNKTLESIAQAIFKEWFVDFRFPGFDGVLVDGLPRGWKKVSLSNKADIQIGRTPPRMETRWFSKDPADIKWISIKDMGEAGVYINNTAEYLTYEAKDRFRIPEIPAETVILSFKLTVGRVCITTEEMLSNEAIAQIQTDLGTAYIYCYFSNFDFKSLGSTSSIATAVNSKSIKGLPLLLPSLSVLKQFHKTVTPLFERIKTNCFEIQSLEKIRNLLLPKLMTGKI